MQVLLARVGEARFAIDTSSVLELIPAIPPRPVPGAAPAILGVVAWRGRVLPVLDLARHLGREPAPPWLSRRIVVCDLSGQGGGAPGPERPLLGILVEEAARVATLEDAVLRAPPEPLPRGAPGMGRMVRLGATLLQLVAVRDLVPRDVLEEILAGAASS